MYICVLISMYTLSANIVHCPTKGMKPLLQGVGHGLNLSGLHRVNESRRPGHVSGGLDLSGCTGLTSLESLNPDLI